LDKLPVRSIAGKDRFIYACQQSTGIFKARLGDTAWQPAYHLPCEGTAILFEKKACIAGTWGCGIHSFSEPVFTLLPPSSPDSQTIQKPERDSLEIAGQPVRGLPFFTMSDTNWTDSPMVIPPAGIRSPVRSSHIDPSKIRHLRYFTQSDREMTILLFNSAGVRIRVLDRGKKCAGLHEIHVDTPQRNQGIYIAEILCNTLRYTVRLALID
jgi:hypothetical protein